MKKMQIVSHMITKTTKHHHPYDHDVDGDIGISQDHLDFKENVKDASVGGSKNDQEKGKNGCLSAECVPLSRNSSLAGSPSALPDDLALLSDGFRSPTRQDMKSSKSFAKKKHKRFPSGSTVFYSPKSLHYSTVASEYERSSIGVDGGEVQGHVLHPVPEETSSLQKKGISAAEVSALRGGFEKATPLIDKDEEEEEEDDEYRINRKQKPFKEFLDEVESIKQRTEVETVRKQLLRKLMENETAIDDWESAQRSKAEKQLDKFEKKQEKKRAKAVQQTHKKLAKISMESEKRKEKARKSILKEMATFPQELHIH